MNNNKKSTFTRPIQAYTVKINTSAFDFHQPCLKEKTQKQFLPIYWKKIGMDQKKVSPSCEDRLSQLTTGQIDRIIDMQKIRSLLYEKKQKAKELYFEYDGNVPNTHPNVYQANFLAKINSIAIKRNIRHQKSEGFDEYNGDQLKKERQKEKKMSAIPYKYAKNYNLDSQAYQKADYRRTEDDDEKSIGSIEDKLEQFQVKLQTISKRSEGIEGRRSRKKEESKINPSRRWFYGMSNHFMNKTEPCQQNKMQLSRIWGYDIEGDISLQRHRTSSSIQSNNKRSTKLFDDRLGIPLSRYRANRVVSIN